MSGRRWAGTGLVMLAVPMFIGFMNSDFSLAQPAALAAFLLTVVLPAAAGIWLLRSDPGARRMEARREDLRRQTLSSEVLRLAAARAGKLTVVEVVTELGVPQDDAKHALDELMRQDMADLEVTPGGVLVYSFRDVQRLGEKSQSRNILE